ncbi:MAG TPA: NADH-ubiquinone oxidoreductase-F iron-sulfur binding region domain-containing protein [Thermoanaerobaculia bacterium]|nr:NADH-ubiquinone oxidoreductase-F iron-sulfur binding region domain-containing protein [Thermoanaerobaculia bacterium]
MDLHFTDDQPTTEEREAIDAYLSSQTPQGDLRQYLLPVLHAIQGRVGWISLGALNHACRALDVPPADAFGVADFYAMFQTRPHPPVAIHVCDDIGCQFRGAEALCAQIAQSGVTWHRSPCLGYCERAPAALVTVAGKPPREVSVAPATAESVLGVLDVLEVPFPNLAASVPQMGQPGLTLLRRIGRIDPWSLDDYRAAGGFLALRRAFEMGPDRVIGEVIEAKLVGRGGAAFPTGQKWLGMRSAPLPRYLVCNADESEPGTFKDRVLMEGDPYSLIESMIIAGFATGCERGYLYIRGEYPLATDLLDNAIRRCRERGFLGTDILGDGVRFDVELRRGAGAYICGEETALLNSLEGYRGEPRNKPPFPTQVGLFGQPTAINNVETLVNVLSILIDGGKAFAAIGTERSTGPKLFCLSGHVRRPGVYEVPFGVTLREVLEMAGGIAGSGRLQAILLGGAAGAFITPDQIDVPLTFEGTRAIGAALGSGVIMPFDDTVDLRLVLRRIAQFFRDESCGQCVPCRVGTVRQEEVLHRLATDRPFGSVEQELALVKELGQVMRDASICGLGQTASSAIESALARFPILQEKR